MFPIIAALSQSAGVILDKIILTRRRVGINVYVPLLFIFLFLTTVILVPFLGKVSVEIWQIKNLMLFGAMILIALVWNFYYYRAIHEEKVQQFELILLFQPLLTILLASLFLKNERNISLEIAAIVAAVALIISQIKKHHFALTQGSIDMIICVIFMSVELIIIEFLLPVINPVALYAIRTAIITIVFYFYWRPKLGQVSGQNAGLIFITAILGSAQMISKFYGFQDYGVIYTSLILILAPLLIYIGSVAILHEKLRAQTAIAALVILGCIVYATVLGK